jgi:replicative DNA helicase
MYEALTDKRAYANTLGCLMKDPTLVEDIDRPLDREDFNTETFYDLLFVAIYNLSMQGCKTIDEFAIDSYLSGFKDQYRIFQENRGLEYLNNIKEYCSLENYDYYYHRLRKYSLLRYYEKQGLDTKFIYDTSVDDFHANEEQQKFDNYTEQDIVSMVESSLVINPTMKYCTNTLTTEVQAADGGIELIEDLMKIPDVGLPLNNNGLNTVTRGARKGCLYMRSLIQGQGKTRFAAGDACKMAVPYIYDTKKKKYIYTGLSEPTLYITTEMPVDEIQTILYATISKVNEEHILYGTYEKGELKRVKQAIEYIESSPLYIVHIPDFSIEDIKNIIKKYNREFGVEYFFFDYISTSLRLMSEINGKSRMGLKEHQLLLVFATELKTIAQQLDVFIFTASQLNGEAQMATYKDQNLLAGSKALANKLDVGIISMRPSRSEQDKLESILQRKFNIPMPDIGHWVYKVRRGRLTHIIIWSKTNLGTMDEEALFVTDFDFNLIDIDFTQIEQVEAKIQEHSVLASRVEDVPVEEDDDEPVQTKAAFDW